MPHKRLKINSWMSLKRAESTFYVRDPCTNAMTKSIDVCVCARVYLWVCDTEIHWWRGERIVQPQLIQVWRSDCWIKKWREEKCNERRTKAHWNGSGCKRFLSVANVGIPFTKIVHVDLHCSHRVFFHIVRHSSNITANGKQKPVPWIS